MNIEARNIEAILDRPLIRHAKLMAMIQTRNQFKAELTKQKRAYEATIAPVTLALVELEVEMASELDRLGTDRERTPLGVVSFSYQESIKVTNRDAFFGWVVVHHAFDCLTSHVSKEAIRERGCVPSGVEITQMPRKICVEKD